MTGPEALLRSVEAYRAGKSRVASEAQDASEGVEGVHPSLLSLAARSAARHDLLVFDTGIIYPFSWSTTEPTGRVHQSCRAAPGFPFDPSTCQGKWHFAPNRIVR
jgi:hypothetical protein